ncbi:MAG: RNase adapter RapZ [Actinomycetia bacterium]|nr:RNase adapter RapZ [Actinomycetes bacterium]
MSDSSSASLPAPEAPTGVTGVSADRPEVLVLTGMSGAGRSTAADALEDLGWFVVDNMPPSLLPRLVELARQGRAAVATGNAESGIESETLRIAAVADVRGGEFFGDLQAALRAVESFGIEPRLVFLEADDDTIVRRFESSRRPHPLQGDGRLVDGIAAERALLVTLRESADLLIDTSPLNVHQLRTRIQTALGHGGTRPVQITVMSFGFKYGLPVDADFVADCRFLPNPYWVPELRPLSGEDAVVSDYVLGQSDAAPFLDAYETALRIALEGYRVENRRYATVALGCTGGRHRSVALSVELMRRLASESVSIRVVHRDLGRE